MDLQCGGNTMRKFRRQLSRAVVIGALSGLLTSTIGCETNPYTGRSQFLMTSVSEEMKMGAQAYDQVKSDPKMKNVCIPNRNNQSGAKAGRVRDCALTVLSMNMIFGIFTNPLLS